jgi:hypothetical protein
MTLMFWLYRAGVALAAAIALCSATNRAMAEADACRDLVGTYLTKNFATGGSGESFTSRSLISLTGSGQGFFTDSGEGGEAGFAPFTDGRGVWRCVSGNKARALTLDFTTPTPEAPRAQIGRLDLDLAYDAGSKTIKGTGTLHLIPLGDDPLIPGELVGGRQFGIVGQRIEAP